MTVTCAVRHDGGRLVAELSGTLDRYSVAETRVRLYKCLAEQPDALLVDLSGLTVDEPLSLAVLTAVVRQAARWPGTPVMFYAPAPRTARLLRAAAYRRLLIFESVQAAREHVGPLAPPTVTDDLLPSAAAPRQARDLVTETCLRWALPHLIAPASLIVSELASNVLDHVQTAMSVRLSLWQPYLQIAVRDGSAVEPQPAGPPAPGRLRGRGLFLIAATAHSWGSLPREGGKVVWAALHTDGRTDSSRRRLGLVPYLRP